MAGESAAYRDARPTTLEHELTMKPPHDPLKRYPFKTIPEDDRRPPEITAQIRALEAQKAALSKSPKALYIETKRNLNREIYRLSKVGIPDDLSWRNNDGRPPFLSRDQGTACVRLSADQMAFCQKMSPKGNVSMGVRACIDFTMSTRQLPALPPELDNDAP